MPLTSLRKSCWIHFAVTKPPKQYNPLYFSWICYLYNEFSLNFLFLFIEFNSDEREDQWKWTLFSLDVIQNILKMHKNFQLNCSWYASSMYVTVAVLCSGSYIREYVKQIGEVSSAYSSMTQFILEISEKI